MKKLNLEKIDRDIARLEEAMKDKGKGTSEKTMTKLVELYNQRKTATGELQQVRA